MQGGLDNAPERLCNFEKSRDSGEIKCKACGRSPEQITQRGPVECLEAARAALAKYEDRIHRGGTHRTAEANGEDPDGEQKRL